MNKILAWSAIALASLLALGSLQRCSEVQRAAGCTHPGFFACTDKGREPSEITQQPAGVKHARPDGRGQQVPVNDGRYRDGTEFPWSRPLDDCMAAGGTRTECFATLPPDLLEQFEAWESEMASQRIEPIRHRSRQPSFGMESVDPNIRD